MAPPPLTPAQFHVLLALADEPLHGYAIMRLARESAGAGVPMGPGTVYGTLARLEEAGWVREQKPSDGRRRTFELLPAGRTALEHEASRVVRLARLLRKKRLLEGDGQT